MDSWAVMERVRGGWVGGGGGGGEGGEDLLRTTGAPKPAEGGCWGRV